MPARSRRVRAGFALRQYRSERWWPYPSLQPVSRRPAWRSIGDDARQRVRHELRPQPVLQLHIFSGRPRRWRPIRAGGRAHRPGWPRHASSSWAFREVSSRERHWHPGARRHHRHGRAVPHSRARAAVDGSRRPCGPDFAGCLRAVRDRVAAATSHDRRPSRRRVSLRRREQRAGKQRLRVGRTRQSQVLCGDRSLGRHRVLRQRGPRVSQQRRARRDHPYRSGQRRTRRARHAARARAGSRVRIAHRPDPGPAVHRHGVDAGHRLGAAVRGRCGDDRSQPSEPALRHRVDELRAPRTLAHRGLRRVLVAQQVHGPRSCPAIEFRVRSSRSCRVA